MSTTAVKVKAQVDVNHAMRLHVDLVVVRILVEERDRWSRSRSTMESAARVGLIAGEAMAAVIAAVFLAAVGG